MRTNSSLRKKKNLLVLVIIKRAGLLIKLFKFNNGDRKEQVGEMVMTKWRWFCKFRFVLCCFRLLLEIPSKTGLLKWEFFNFN